MYKCGWNGCEKAYGTLNHLNAHVTMQSHGSKRTPEGECSNGRVGLSATRRPNLPSPFWPGLRHVPPTIGVRMFRAIELS
jgi:hypothetical protein